VQVCPLDFDLPGFLPQAPGARRCNVRPDLMITVQTNTQPPEGNDKLGNAINALYEIVKQPKAN